MAGAVSDLAEFWGARGTQELTRPRFPPQAAPPQRLAYRFAAMASPEVHLERFLRDEWDHLLAAVATMYVALRSSCAARVPPALCDDANE